MFAGVAIVGAVVVGAIVGFLAAIIVGLILNSVGSERHLWVMEPTRVGSWRPDCSSTR